MANIAFDIDDTLYMVVWEERNGELIPTGQVPDYEVLQLLISLFRLGNRIFVWSAGGMDYAKHFVQKFGLTGVIVIEKSKASAELCKIDITFDDQIITLGKVNIQIPREKYEQD